MAAGDSILVGRRWFGIGVVGIAAYFRQIFLSERYYNRGWEGRMTDLFLKHVSVAESGGEYFQVSFADNEESDDSYFLVQRQFESPYPGRVYVESHLRTLSGHFRIRRAELERSLFRLDIMCQPPETVQIRFQADETQFNRLKEVLRIMLPSSVLKIE
ncbi:MAG: hypothetical protein ABSC21_23435 [Terriglobia bacterium]